MVRMRLKCIVDFNRAVIVLSFCFNIDTYISRNSLTNCRPMLNDEEKFANHGLVVNLSN